MYLCNYVVNTSLKPNHCVAGERSPPVGGTMLHHGTKARSPPKHLKRNSSFGLLQSCLLTLHKFLSCEIQEAGGL